MSVVRIFSRRWLLSTFLVICAVMVMVRLGIWQLDRLEQRRAFNARVQAQIERSPLDLNAEANPSGLSKMEYRKVQVSGLYDHSQQIALKNQYWGNQWGVHLVTPLSISGSDQVILVDRGWIPSEDYLSGDWSKYDEPGVVSVSGILRQSQSKADFGKRSDPQVNSIDQPLNAWNFVNIQQLSLQMSASLLPAYIQQAPDPAWTSMPYRFQPQLDLTEGPHFGYALQWFTFAAILGIGYILYFRRQERQRNHNASLKSNQFSSTATALPGKH